MVLFVGGYKTKLYLAFDFMILTNETLELSM